ncbi:hypothetical protein OAF75_01640, partial [Verrucomicrobiales bacterium]|nr:hypothetical protein [Verrucomicrobiales bacterium]
EKEELIEFVCKKLEFTYSEWNKIMESPPVPYKNYKYSKLMNHGSWFYNLGRKIATKRGTR